MASHSHDCAHLVMLPWPSQGNINPMMQLAIRLAAPDFLVTFVHSQRNYSLLTQRQCYDTSVACSSVPNPHLRISAISDGLADDQNSRPTTAQLLESATHLEKGFYLLIDKLSREEPPVSCIMAHTFLVWTQDVANKFGVPRVDFWASNATNFSMLFHTPALISEGFLPVKDITNGDEEEGIITSIPGISPIHRRDLPKALLVEDVAGPAFEFVVGPFRRTREATCVLIHTFYELESKVIDGLREQNLSIFPVGPLLPSVAGKDAIETSLFKTDETCLPWLDGQAPFSVLYIAFGSFNTLSTDEIKELALGLESSEHPFIWVIRPDSVEGSIADVLPEGFMSRIQNRGLIMDWAPQLSVLSHQAVGGFFTHCGWNSTLESIFFGVPMLLWPRHADQESNSKLITEKWGVGVALRLRKEEGGLEISKEAVEEGVRAVMEGGEEGSERRRKVGELQEAARRAVDDASSSSSSSSVASLNAFREFIIHTKPGSR